MAENSEKNRNSNIRNSWFLTIGPKNITSKSYEIFSKKLGEDRFLVLKFWTSSNLQFKFTLAM